MANRALVTGIGGQDAGYLAEQLLAEGCEVWGLARGVERVADLPWLRGVRLIEGDLTDAASLRDAIDRVGPTEVYNLASYSQPSRAWTEPEPSAEVNALGPLRLLEAIVAYDRSIRFCQAGTSEVFGDSDVPLSETTPHRPRSPYGSAKAFAHQIVGHYRQRYGLFACGAILFNHESPRRGPEFVTRKITLAAARIRLGQQASLVLGNTDGRRDWGFAPDYVRAMRMMLRADVPEDFVIGTGETHTVAEIVEIAFARAGVDPRTHLVIDPSETPPGKRAALIADARRARERLGWAPSIGFREMIELMVDADLELAARQAVVAR